MYLSLLRKILLPPIVSYGVVLLFGFLFTVAPNAFGWVPWITNMDDRNLAMGIWALLSALGWLGEIAYAAIISECSKEGREKWKTPVSFIMSGDNGGYCDGCGSTDAQPAVQTKDDHVFCKKCVKKMYEILPS